MKLYQIHGFGSIGDNSTANWLKKTFPEIELIHPDHPVNPAHGLSFAMRELLEHGFMTEGGCLYGTSLGGFYALMLHWITGLPAILVNPSLQPWKTMKARTGQNINYYTGEPFNWLAEYTTALQCFGEMLETVLFRRERLLVIVGSQDDIVPPEHTMRFFARQQIPPIVLDKQGHRIDKATLPVNAIRDFFERPLDMADGME